MEEFVKVISQLASGFSVSLILFTITLITAIPLGLLISFCSMSKVTPIRIFTKVIVWILRGTPLMLQLFIIYYGPGLVGWFNWSSLNTGWTWFDKTFDPRFIASIIAFAINYAAYFSEIFRGGIQSITKGQTEAGQVLGMTKGQIFSKIVLLQVIKRIVPPMSNEIITLVKDTSLAKTVGVLELIFRAQDFLDDGIIWPFLCAGLFYLIFVGLLTIIFNKIEKKLSYFKA
ncbi:MAG: amino acid ABC transporter permease [Clostridia bacterium]|nr:amino acid ABC transporter permease [Clostridia bacterium]